jgi:hypothetical protein
MFFIKIRQLIFAVFVVQLMLFFTNVRQIIFPIWESPFVIPFEYIFFDQYSTDIHTLNRHVYFVLKIMYCT